MWRQKCKLKWRPEGDENTKFFHNDTNARIKKNLIKEIQKDSGESISNEDLIVNEFVSFTNLYTKTSGNPVIPSNIEWQPIDTINKGKEIDEVVDDLSSNRALGPDDYTREFLQKGLEHL